MTYRLTRLAAADIAAVLRATRKQFGREQVSAYAGIIEDGIAMVAASPSRPTIIDRGELGPRVKSFHLELVRRRRRSASHMLYFLTTEKAETVVLRVLHESMEPKRRLIRAIRDLDN